MGTLSVDKLMKTSTGAAEFTLPATDGTAGQSMVTDGSGQLSLGNPTLPADSVTTTEILDGTIISANLADDAVATAKIAALAVTPAKMATSAYTANRNIIINGNFNVWQRGTSFAAVANATYAPDRFFYEKTGAMVHTITRDADVPTQAQSGLKSLYSMKVDCTTVDASIAAGDFCNLVQRIEGYNFSQLEGNTGTISFWVKATKTGTYCVSVISGSSDRSYVSEYTVSVADTWEKKTATIVFNYSGGGWNYGNGIGLQIKWALATGSNYQGVADTWNSAQDTGTSNQVNACDSTSNNFFLSQVQLEVSPTATPFEHKTYGQELQACQRYYQKLYSGQEGPMGVYVDSSYIYSYFYPLIVEMRTSPTLDQGSSSPSFEYRYSGWQTDGTFSSSNLKTMAIRFRLSQPTAVDTYGIATMIEIKGTWSVDAEL